MLQVKKKKENLETMTEIKDSTVYLPFLLILYAGVKSRHQKMFSY